MFSWLNIIMSIFKKKTKTCIQLMNIKDHHILICSILNSLLHVSPMSITSLSQFLAGSRPLRGRTTIAKRMPSHCRISSYRRALGCWIWLNFLFTIAAIADLVSIANIQTASLLKVFFALRGNMTWMRMLAYFGGFRGFLLKPDWAYLMGYRSRQNWIGVKKT